MPGRESMHSYQDANRNSKVKTAFVTGGAGFLGINLIEELISGSWDVTVFDLQTANLSRFTSRNVKLVQGDITNAAACVKAMPENVDAVFHLAGNTNHWRLGDRLQTRVNVGGTGNIVAAALKRNARCLVHTSSIAAYGFQPERITEDTRSTAAGASINYFRTKRLSEIEVHKGIKKGLKAVILNPANIIGPFDTSGWSRIFLLVEKGRLPGAPPGKASFCHSREVARAHILAAEKGTSGANYLLGGADATFFEMVQQIGKLMNRKVPGRPTPAFLMKLVGRLSYWGSCFTRKEPDLTPETACLTSSELLCSSQKAVKELGYRTVSLEDMLSDCHRWMIDAGLLEAP
ncbi:MAG: oxidoreductase [Deltaproteobacteria bacterium]|nr:MAG: oxidoreductase [Deltaproteobacteria bacterium]